MADDKPKFGVEMVRAIEEGGEFDDTHGVVNLKLTQGTLPLAFTGPQLQQLIGQLPVLLGKLKGTGGVVWGAERWRVALTLDGSLRFDFGLPGGASLSVAIPIDGAAQVVDQIQAVAEKSRNLPPEKERH